MDPQLCGPPPRAPGPARLHLGRDRGAASTRTGPCRNLRSLGATALCPQACLPHLGKLLKWRVLTFTV